MYLKKFSTILESYHFIMLFILSVQNLRSNDGKQASVLKIPVSILKPAIPGSY